MSAWRVPTGTIVNLGQKAYERHLPERHHRFTAATLGKIAYVLEQERTEYGGKFFIVLPITGSDPTTGGMIWVGWLSVHREELPRLRRVAKRVPPSVEDDVRQHMRRYLAFLRGE